MHNWTIAAGMSLITLVAAANAPAAQTELVHVSSIDLSTQFGAGTGYGNNPLSVAFDGTNAYVGGYNNGGAAANVGVVKVSGLFGTGATITPLAATQFSAANLRGLDALAYDANAGALFMAYDSGTATTSFISRNDPVTGAASWTISNPQASRPFAMSIDPTGDGGSPGVGFLVQGSGRRRLLRISDGASVFDGTTGGIINTDPTTGTTWRALEFDSDGNVVVGNQQGYGYGRRVNANQWEELGGTDNVTERSALKDVTVNNVGQGIVIMEDLGGDLLALSGRNQTTLTDSLGAVTAAPDTQVHIRNLDGSVTGLTQVSLTGAENGIGTAWLGDTKNLVFGLDASGVGTLLVLDFDGRRLDVYQVPEPASMAMIGLGAFLLARRRRA